MQTDPSLFDLPPRQRVYLPGDPPPPIRVEIPTPITWGAVHAFLAANGQCAQELSKSRRELIHELQARMVFRTSENVYQAPACTIPLFGRSHAVAFFANLPRQVDTKEVVTWDVSDPDLIAPLLTPFTDAHANCIGQSKAMGCTKLNPFVNVVSTLFNMVASSVCRGGRDLMYVNALYILMNDVGEIDYPKTKEKRPMAVSWEDEQLVFVTSVATSASRRVARSGVRSVQRHTARRAVLDVNACAKKTPTRTKSSDSAEVDVRTTR